MQVRLLTSREEIRRIMSGRKPRCDTITELRADTASLKQLKELEEIVDVPPERGGVYFSDWERTFIKSVSAQFDAEPMFTAAQREKIKDIWRAVDLRKRGAPDVKTENLFSRLSPERQAEQRARAARVRLPWEK
jgi:hypothetical protein